MNISNPFILGLLIGDGSFQINHWKKKYLQYRIVCKLKSTDNNFLMLKNLKNVLNFGKIKTHHGNVLWVVDNRKDIKNYLNLVFDTGLINYVLVPRVKLKLYQLKYSIDNSVSYDEYTYMQNNDTIWSKVLSSNAYVISNYINLDYTILSQILCGLIEAEGCFSIRKNGNMSFSISQLEGEELIRIYKDLFLLPNKIRKINYKPNPNTCNSISIIETYNKLSISRIIEFIEFGHSPYSKYPQDKLWCGLQGEKLKSFKEFKIYYLSKNNYN